MRLKAFRLVAAVVVACAALGIGGTPPAGAWWAVGTVTVTGDYVVRYSHELRQNSLGAWWYEQTGRIELTGDACVDGRANTTSLDTGAGATCRLTLVGTFATRTMWPPVAGPNFEFSGSYTPSNGGTSTSLALTGTSLWLNEGLYASALAYTGGPPTLWAGPSSAWGTIVSPGSTGMATVAYDLAPEHWSCLGLCWTPSYSFTAGGTFRLTLHTTAPS